ncbi:hypothetical protein GVX82_01165 [Patescibacteria group bacterium]|jgi:nucleotidyltransferase substrate binding protein (TIGR01987 family)|nr:hypothetical protein [Patescibacteria group bacterium]
MHAVISSFSEALERLEEAVAAEKTELHRDAAIQRFGYTIELAWKAIQKYLRSEHEIDCRSPKRCLQDAFSVEVIADDPLWSDMLHKRNLTSHTYYETIAEEVYTALPSYLPLLRELEQVLTTRET